MDRVLLFGAGASYGSGHVLPFAPPLGGALFSELRCHYPTVWGAIPEPYTSEFNKDFECGMSMVMNAGLHCIGPMMQTMALYFASFIPDDTGQNLYVQLLRALRDQSVLQRTLISTLNYECLIELAATQAKIATCYDLVQTCPSGAARIWKLHGSCNFLPHPKSNQQKIRLGRDARYSWGATFNSALVSVHPAKVASWVQSDNALYPAMCMFAPNKLSQISPQVFREYWKAWGEIVRNADKVALVGVRPHDPDAHIWKPIEESRGTVIFVGGEESFRALKGRRAGRPTAHLSETFEDGIQDLLTEFVA